MNPEILCTGCKHLGKDYWVPCSDEPELKFEMYICYSPDSPGKDGAVMGYTCDEATRAEWCLGKGI